MNKTILVTLNITAPIKAHPTKVILYLCRHLLDYCTTFSAITIKFYVSNMILHIDHGATYLVAP